MGSTGHDRQRNLSDEDALHTSRKPAWTSRPAIAATALLLALALQCFDLRAELLFRSAEQRDGQQQWSGLRKYANPADTAYPRTRADGARVSSEEVQVFVRGYITREDVYGAKVMESLIRRGRQRIAGNAVSLAGSSGAAADARSPQNYESAPPAVGSYALPEKPDAQRPAAGDGIAGPPRTSF